MAVCNEDCFNCIFEDCIFENFSNKRKINDVNSDKELILSYKELSKEEQRNLHEEYIKAKRRENSRNYYKNNTEKVKDKSRKYYMRNKDAMNKKCKDYYMDKKEKDPEWYEAYKKYQREYHREHYKKLVCNNT